MRRRSDAARQGRSRRARLPALLGEREFTRFWAGQTISLFGDQVTLIALPLLAVLVLHADAAQMGYLAAAGLAPNLFFSLHAGRACRRPRAPTADDDRGRPGPRRAHRLQTLWIGAVGAVAGVLFLLRSPLPRLRVLPDGAG